MLPFGRDKLPYEIEKKLKINKIFYFSRKIKPTIVVVIFPQVPFVTIDFHAYLLVRIRRELADPT